MEAADLELVNFQIDEPHRYRYSYQSDGKTFVAIAEADLDCDGVVSTYMLEGAVTDGDPFFQVHAYQADPGRVAPSSKPAQSTMKQPASVSPSPLLVSSHSAIAPVAGAHGVDHGAVVGVVLGRARTAARSRTARQQRRGCHAGAEHRAGRVDARVERDDDAGADAERAEVGDARAQVEQTWAASRPRRA